MVSVSEQQRFEMHAGLKSILGVEMANTLMEHLPPSGWSDVARQRDVEDVRREMDGLRREMDGLRRDINRVNGTLKVLIGSVISVAVAIMVMLIQVNLNISGL